MNEVTQTTMRPNTHKGIFKTSVAVLLVAPALIFWSTVGIVLLIVLLFLARDDEQCNVARVPIQGVLTTTDNGLGMILGFGVVASADGIIDEIMQAEKDDEIEAILLDIDSPGGTPVAGDEIMKALKTVSKPTVAVIRDRGTSAAYWAAVGADYIIASPVSDVGSIGVTMSYLELASSTDISGSRWIDISSGEYKDAGRPERILSEKEKEHFQGQVDDVHEYMVNQIAEARSSMTREEIAQLADGRAYLGTEALELKLIDEVGSFREASVYLDKRLQIYEDITLCPAMGGGIEDLLY